MKTEKRLCKVREDKAICGVCGGIAAYWDVDPIVIRLAMVLLTLTFGLGLLIYIVLAVIMPVCPAADSDRPLPDLTDAVHPVEDAETVLSGEPVSPGHVSTEPDMTADSNAEISLTACDTAETATAADKAGETVLASESAQPAVGIAETAAAVCAGETIPAAENYAGADPIACGIVETTLTADSNKDAGQSAGGSTEPVMNAKINVQTARIAENRETAYKTVAQPASATHTAQPSAERGPSYSGSMQSGAADTMPRSSIPQTHENYAGRRGGVALIIFGVALLLKFLIPFLSIYLLGSIAAIASGIVLVAKNK